MLASKKGFSLLELLIVFIIIGILSAATIPSYQRHIIKAKVLDAMTFVNSIKIATTDFYFQHGFWPNNNQLDLNKNINNHAYIEHIVLSPNNTNDRHEENILITFKGDSKLENKLLILNSNIDNYHITWICKPSDINKLDNELLPASCKNK